MRLVRGVRPPQLAPQIRSRPEVFSQAALGAWRDAINSPPKICGCSRYVPRNHEKSRRVRSRDPVLPALPRDLSHRFRSRGSPLASDLCTVHPCDRTTGRRQIITSHSQARTPLRTCETGRKARSQTTNARREPSSAGTDCFGLYRVFVCPATELPYMDYLRWRMMMRHNQGAVAALIAPSGVGPPLHLSRPRSPACR